MWNRISSFIFYILLGVGMASAQSPLSATDNAFWNDINGRPLKFLTDYRMDGSPYYYDEYCLADIYMSNGKKYENAQVKLDLVEKEVLFMTEKGEEMVAIPHIKKIRFYNYYHNGVAKDPITITSFKLALNEKGAEIFEVLVDSTIKLGRMINVSYTDSKGYNDASITRTYKRTESLMALIPSKSEDPVKLQRNKTAILKLLDDKKNQVAAYIEKNNLKCKSDKDIIQVFHYYNSL